VKSLTWFDESCAKWAIDPHGWAAGWSKFADAVEERNYKNYRRRLAITIGKNLIVDEGFSILVF
jgi:hypothetical protein